LSCLFCRAWTCHWGNENFHDGSLLRITQAVLPDCENKSMRALYHRNRGNAYSETVENWGDIHGSEDGK
jgi:hypothetical protein